MTWEEYIRKFKQDILQAVPTTMERTIAFNALALIRHRIARRGERADGGMFKPYSRVPILVGASTFTTEKARARVFGSKTKRRALDWRTIRTPRGLRRLALLPGGYAQVRQIEGRQIAHKDFERTSEMWKSIHVLGVRSTSPGKYTALIGTRNTLSQRKLAGHAAREGAPILDLSSKEIDILSKELVKILADLL